jgi:hypothetical protein
LTLNVEDFGAQFLKPAMAAIADGIDKKVLELYKDIPYSFDISGTPVKEDIIALDKIMNILRVPQQDRRLVMSPAGKASYVGLDAFLNAEKRGSTEAIRNANLGHVLGFDTFMDQNVWNHTEGDLAGTATITGAAGALTGTIASGGNAKTIKRGDKFAIATLTEAAPYNQFVCTEDMTTTSGGAGTLKFYPALPEGGITAQVITVDAQGDENLAFHKNAFALVVRPLAKVMDGTRCDVVNYNGLSLRVTYGHDISGKKTICSVDTLVGVKTLTPELAVRLAG